MRWRTFGFAGTLCFLLGACGGGGGGGGIALLAADATGSVIAGQPAQLRVHAPAFVGTVRFESTDVQATVPDTYTFTASDAGSREFTFVFRTAGKQIVTFFVEHGNALTGSAEVRVSPGPFAALRVDVAPVQPGAEGAAFAGRAFVDATDAFGNTVPSFDAGQDPVTITSAPSDGTLGGNVLDTSADFAAGRADVAGRLVFTWSGADPVHRFVATSASGVTGTSGPVEIVTAVHVMGYARYHDVNNSFTIDEDDVLVVCFERDVTVTDPSPVFDMLVDEDSFGGGATVRSGPARNEVTIVLGPGARLRSRGMIDPTGETSNSSGIDLSPDLRHGGIRDGLGLPAEASAWVDIVPGFLPVGPGLGSADTHDIAAADLDHDGDIDLVCANQGEPSCVYLKGGDGTWQARPLSMASGAWAVALGDVNGDGRIDAVFGNEGGNEVWLGDGTGNLAFSSSYGTQRTLDVELADVDLDGDLDLIAANEGTSRIWLNDRTGSFAPSGATFGGQLTGAVAAGDLNGDGRIDLVTGSSGLTVWTAGGNGDFGVSQVTGGLGSHAIVLGDLDGDGDLDAVAAALDGVRPYFNDGRGGLTAGPVLPSSTGVRSVGLADFDKNGGLDILSGTRLWVNDGKGNFADLGIDVGEPAANALAIVNLDGDGDEDLAFANGDREPNRIYQGSLTGTYGEIRSLELFGGPIQSASLAVALGDFDHDGDVDILSGTGSYAYKYDLPGGDATARGDNRIWLNNGEGHFADREVIRSEDVSELAVGDLDRDGDLDVVTVGRGGDRVWKNDGSAEFSLGQELGNTETVSVALADIDGDGDLDLLRGTKSGCHVRLNDGTGTFGASSADFVSVFTRRIAVGDIDGDGDPDVVTAHAGVANRIFVNDGKGQLQDSRQYLDSDRTYDIHLVDVDRDGDLDIVAANNTQPNRVYRNDGKGSFTNTGQALGNTCTNAIAFIDLDCDGDLDMVEGNDSVADVIWQNDGQGNFTDSTMRLPPGGTLALCVDDLDGDGDPDFFQANWAGLYNDTVYFNK